jgi:hypothetical protein
MVVLLFKLACRQNKASRTKSAVLAEQSQSGRKIASGRTKPIREDERVRQNKADPGGRTRLAEQSRSGGRARLAEQSQIRERRMISAE